MPGAPKAASERYARTGNEGVFGMKRKRATLGSAVLGLLIGASGSLAQEKANDAIDCSAFHKEKYGYLVTKTTRIAAPPLDVTVPKGMPIRRGQKEASVQGKNLADIIDQNCAS
jgi:hypothetical protein